MSWRIVAREAVRVSVAVAISAVVGLLSLDDACGKAVAEALQRAALVGAGIRP